MNSLKLAVVTTTGIFGTVITTLYGGWTKDMTTLLIFMAIDFMLGLAIAAFWKKSEKSTSGALSSRSAWKGLIKKGACLLVVLVAYRLDLALGLTYIKSAVIIAFIVSESISIVENLGIIGVPLPSALTKAIDLLTEKEE